jgi:hypothetical protein
VNALAARQETLLRDLHKTISKQSTFLNLLPPKVYKIDFISKHPVSIFFFVATGEVSTLAGSQNKGHIDGIGKTALFSYPYGILFDETWQSLLVCDSNNSNIRRVELNGMSLFIHFLSDILFLYCQGAVSTLCSITGPKFIVSANNVFLVSGRSKIFKLTREGAYFFFSCWQITKLKIRRSN